MTTRTEAGLRVWAFLWGQTAGYGIMSVASIVGLLWGFIDVTWRLITGREDLHEDSTPAKLVSSSFQWYYEQNMFALIGEYEFRWFPDI